MSPFLFVLADIAVALWLLVLIAGAAGVLGAGLAVAITAFRGSRREDA